MSDIRLHRQCPHCKSKKGFRLEYTIGGYGHEERNFNGKVLDAEREVVDNNDKDAECLDCNGRMDVDKVEAFS